MLEMWCSLALAWLLAVRQLESQVQCYHILRRQRSEQLPMLLAE